jgi:hypothetical protein
VAAALQLLLGSPDVFAATLNHVAALVREEARFPQALALYQRVLALAPVGPKFLYISSFFSY